MLFVVISAFFYNFKQSFYDFISYSWSILLTTNLLQLYSLVVVLDAPLTCFLDLLFTFVYPEMHISCRVQCCYFSVTHPGL